MAITRGGTTVPVATSVAQETNFDGTNLWPSQHNKSNSGGFGYQYLSTAATTTVRSVPGRLCRVHVVGTGGTLGAITIYDNTAGSGQVVWSKATPVAETVYDLQIPVVTGITVVTAAATTILVTWE